MAEEGYFQCPKYDHNIVNCWDKQQKRNERWIFRLLGRDWGHTWNLNLPQQDPNVIWKKFGERTEEEWNRNSLECVNCHYKSNTFIDFIAKYRITK